MDTFLIGILNIFIRIVESPACFVLTCVIGSGLGVYYYRHPDNDIVLCILISLIVLFLFSVFFFVKIKYEKRRNDKQQKKKEDELVSEDVATINNWREKGQNWFRSLWEFVKTSLEEE